MAVARHGSGVRATLVAAASQVHPVFMLPPLVASWFGAILATDLTFATGIVHSLAIFAAVYTAHVKDGYIDYYVRGEDADHPLTRRGCHLCLIFATVIFAGCILTLWLTVNWVAAAITAPTWLIGYFHAPQLDMSPLGATLGYPVGIGFSVVGGYYVQATTFSLPPLAYALILVFLLAGIKIIDDEQDVRYDRSIGKPTIAVLLGAGRARLLSVLLFCVALVGVGLFSITGTFPTGAIVAAGILGVVILLALPADPVTATALLIRGSYVFFAVLLAVTGLDMR